MSFGIWNSPGHTPTFERPQDLETSERLAILCDKEVTAEDVDRYVHPLEV